MTPPIVGSGISAQLAFLLESTWGVCASGTFAGATPIEMKNESLELKKTTVQGQGLHGGGLYDRANRRVVTNYDVNGSVTVDLPNRGLGKLLQHMTGSPNSLVAGAAALSAPTQIVSTLAYESYHSPGNTMGLSLSWQKGVPSVDGVVEPFTYVGTKINDWELSVATGAIAQLVLQLDGMNELGGAHVDPLNASVPTLFSWSETGIDTTADPLKVLHFRQAAVLSGGTPTLTAGKVTLAGASALGNVTAASVKETKSMDTARYFLGTAGYKAEQIENGFRSVTGSFDVEWLSAETMYNAFAADTTTSLMLSFVGDNAGTSGANKDTLTIILPSIKLDGESPKVGGPGVVSQSCAFTALDDEATTPGYQMHYISSDATY